MAVFAHPDDEAYGTGGTLARYAAEGVDVHVVTATRGEAGEIAEPDMATAANLPFVRERELRCACRAYGVQPPHFLEYMDGQLTIVHQGAGRWQTGAAHPRAATTGAHHLRSRWDLWAL